MRCLNFSLFCLLLLLAPIGCGIFIEGSGQITERSFPITAFQRIEANFTFRLTLRQGEAYSVLVRADENIWPFLTVEKTETEALYIGHKRGTLLNSVRGTLEATITLPKLDRLTLSGASMARLSGQASGTLQLRLSGASRFFYTDELTLDILEQSGASEIKRMRE